MYLQGDFDCIANTRVISVFEEIMLLNPITSPPRYFLSVSFMSLCADKHFFTSKLKTKNRRILMLSSPFFVGESSHKIMYLHGDVDCIASTRVIAVFGKIML